MKIELIYLIDQNGFHDVIKTWADQKGIEVAIIDPKSDDFLDLIDGMTLIHENHNFSKEAEELQNYLNKNNRPTHKIDINGTVAATASNFTMWTERNKTKKLLLVGGLEVIQNPNLNRFLSKI